jgi:hypothetical protein
MIPSKINCKKGSEKKKTLSNIDIRKENKAKKKPIPVSFSNS